MMRRENVYAIINYNARQRNGNGLALPFRYMPLILIPNVLEDNLCHVHIASTVTPDLIGGRGSGLQEHHGYEKP